MHMTKARPGVLKLIVKEARRDHLMEIFTKQAVERNTRVRESLVCLEVHVFSRKGMSMAKPPPPSVHGKFLSSK